MPNIPIIDYELSDRIRTNLFQKGLFSKGGFVGKAPQDHSWKKEPFREFLQKMEGERMKSTILQNLEKKVEEEMNRMYLINKIIPEDIVRISESLSKLLGTPKGGPVTRKERKKGHTKTLVQFIKNKKGERIGVFVAYRPNNGDFGTGWSLCNKKDKFSTMEAMKLSYERMFKPYIETPPSIRVSFLKFADRAERFFEGGMECFLPTSSKNFDRFFSNLPEDLKNKIKPENEEKQKEKKPKNSQTKYYRSICKRSGSVEFFDEITEFSAEHIGHFKVTVESVPK